MPRVMIATMCEPRAATSCVPSRSQLLHQGSNRNGTSIGLHGEGVIPGKGEQPAGRLNILAGRDEAPAGLRLQGALDLDGPALATGKHQQQIDLGAARGAVEKGVGPIGSGGDQVLDHQPLPTGPDNRMAEEHVQVTDAEERMDHAAVAHIDLRRLHQSFGDIDMEGRQPADQHQIDQEIEITYLTGGISWKADYVLRLGGDEKLMDLHAWVTLNNSSGAPYINAQLKLVAGDVNIARPEIELRRGLLAARAAPVQEMREEAFAEYHLYTLPRRTTIKENQSKQVSLFKADEVGVTKEYEYRGSGHYFSRRVQPMGEEHVNVFLKFVNEEENNLGVPLPAGIMRIYQEDSEGMLQFSGEDRIGHTPKDEEVRLRMGSAFDVIGERKQTDFRRISDRVFESAYEVRVRNHKETAIVVDVVEPMSSDWEILESSHEFEKRDAQTAVFALPVEADAEVVLTYRVRVRY